MDLSAQYFIKAFQFIKAFKLYRTRYSLNYICNYVNKIHLYKLEF